MNQPTWHILGFGAIGQILHSGFVKKGQRCKVIARADRDQSDTHSATRDGDTHRATKDSDTHRVTRDDQTREIPIEWVKAADTGPIAHLLVCTKSYDAIEAIQSVSKGLSADSQVIILINGMLDTQDVKAASKGAQLYWGLTTEGGYRTSPFDTMHAGTGSTKVGGGNAPPWFDLWLTAHPRSEWVEDIEPHRWQKLCINAAINPLTAINGCLNGELMRDPLADKTQQLIAELGILLSSKGYAEIADTFPAVCKEVICRTAKNQSSMLQDIQNAKRTEIDLILPPLLHLAENNRIPVPTLKDLYETFVLRFNQRDLKAP